MYKTGKIKGEERCDSM